MFLFVIPFRFILSKDNISANLSKCMKISHKISGQFEIENIVYYNCNYVQNESNGSNVFRTELG